MLLLLTLVVSCGRTSEDRATPSADVTAADSAFASVPDSAWVSVTGLTLVGFFPIVSNEQLDKDGDLATVLDDSAYYIGSAMDSFVAAGTDAIVYGVRTNLDLIEYVHEFRRTGRLAPR